MAFNQIIHQSILNQPNNQLTNIHQQLTKQYLQSINQTNNQSDNQSKVLSLYQTINQKLDELTSDVSPTFRRYAALLLGRDQPNIQSENQSNNRSNPGDEISISLALELTWTNRFSEAAILFHGRHQTINQSINQSTDQSTNQLVDIQIARLLDAACFHRYAAIHQTSANTNSRQTIDQLHRELSVLILDIALELITRSNNQLNNQTINRSIKILSICCQLEDKELKVNQTDNALIKQATEQSVIQLQSLHDGSDEMVDCLIKCLLETLPKPEPMIPVDQPTEQLNEQAVTQSINQPAVESKSKPNSKPSSRPTSAAQSNKQTNNPSTNPPSSQPKPTDQAEQSTNTTNSSANIQSSPVVEPTFSTRFQLAVIDKEYQAVIQPKPVIPASLRERVIGAMVAIGCVRIARLINAATINQTMNPPANQATLPMIDRQFTRPINQANNQPNDQITSWTTLIQSRLDTAESQLSDCPVTQSNKQSTYPRDFHLASSACLTIADAEFINHLIIQPNNQSIEQAVIHYRKYLAYQPKNISRRAVHRLLFLVNRLDDCPSDELIRLHSMLVTTPVKGFDQSITRSHVQPAPSFLSFACDSMIEGKQSSCCWPLINHSVNQPVPSSLAALALINHANDQSINQSTVMSTALRSLNLDPWQDCTRQLSHHSTNQLTNQSIDQSTWQHVASLIDTPSIQDAVKRLEETVRLQMAM